jgi:protein deglycase
MAKRVLIALADGFEEIEAITVIDILRRAGLQVITVGIDKQSIEGAHGIKVEADQVLTADEAMPDALVLPGGMPGSKNLAESNELKNLISKMNSAKKTIGAICAAPALVLAPQGLLDHRKATCYPGFEKSFGDKTSFVPDRVVCDGHVVTSRGPGSAIEFSLELVRQLVDAATAKKLAQGLLTTSSRM